MIILGILALYLALAAWFYVALTRTAADASLPALPRTHKWLRPRRLRENSILRRLRPLLSLRLPKRK